jgi:prepilin-type N-terminal cleavage/methylation domain-containing protein
VGKPRQECLCYGVTLIEMMVVVAIVGLIAAISYPSAAAGIDSARLVSATNSVASFLNSAVNRVERRQQALALTISVKENRLTLYSNEPGFTRELRLPDGISLIGSEEDRRLILMPGATVPAIGIELANQRGARRMVRLDPMTGFPRVESVTTKE